MRKTLFAMLGLVALGLWALPTMAAVSNGPPKDPPLAQHPVALENRPGFHGGAGGNYQGTLSGTLIKNAQTTTTWFLYPGACVDRANGTWVARATPQADSLNTYTPGSTGPYGVLDQSLSTSMWHISDNATCTVGTNCPPALNGTRMIWCGKFDANWVVKYGYPNLTYQILYVNTGTHTGNYNLTFNYQISVEFNYDYVWIVGGSAAGGGVDPVGNARAVLDGIIGANGYAVQWTGSITPSTSGATGGNTAGTAFNIQSNPGAPATVTGASFAMLAADQAVYFVMSSDCLYSSEDGNWPEGHGQLFDNLGTSDHGAGSIYTDTVASGGLDAFSGSVLVGTPSAPIVSARVAPGVGTLWQLVAGTSMPTPDICTPKNTSGDLIFEGANASNFHTIPNQFNSVVTCSFPVPTGTASVLAIWDEYLDLPDLQGYTQYSEYRIFKDGSWGGWANTRGGDIVQTGALQAWTRDGNFLGAATQADSVQIRYNIQCIPFFAADQSNCGDVTYGVLYDNFRLELTSGVPAPIFGVFVGTVAQSMFVDGTMSGLNCSSGTVSAGQCWPGVRGSDAPAPTVGLAPGVHDNFNSPYGDSITLSVTTGLRKNGKGVNWHLAFDKAVNFGTTIAHTNPNFVPGFDTPRIIYRMFDPASKNWSPFDSSELDANNFSANAGDTILVGSFYRMNWPPRDKASSSLPSGFTINGKALYSQLKFLPRGTRVQYYWKGVDINGGTSYQFSSDALAHEVEDLPTLPGSSIVAPDIIEFNVLPRVYAVGAGGTQLAGRTNTPLLDLDGSYTSWDYGSHGTVQVLRSLGVRSDRYRTLQGLGAGGHIGGHEFAGTRPGRLSNYFPNMDEYSIKDSLAGWYRIMIESSHNATSAVDEESDSKLIKQWWEASTGNDGGDRCLFASGDDYFNGMLSVTGVNHPNESDLATLVFGVASVENQWNGGTSVALPVIKDMFADPLAGPALGVSGAYTYFIDGGCPAPNRFDNLIKSGSADTQNSATYPTFASVTNVAAVSRMAEQETGIVTPDHDRNKALGYGFSIQFIRQGGENLVDTRAQVLYKFLTSCRGPRAATDTASCWPCPTDANKYGNWATLAGFSTGTYGPLYSLQDATRALSGVDPVASVSPVNRLQGNFPNPFNPQTAIRFSSAKAGRVDVRIFDVAGRLVQTISRTAAQGVNEVRWNGQSSDGRSLASGVYFVKVKYADGTESLNGLKIAIVR